MRIEQLTFTRFIAAISIVIFHYGKESFLFNNDYVSFLFKQANVGVSYFFILSGFVLIIAYHRSENLNFFKFIKNRLARIYPVYFLAIFLVVLLKSVSKIEFTDLFLNVFMIQAWIPEKALTVNYPGWSLSVELFFYIVFPILFNRFYKKVSFRIAAFIIILFWVICQVLFYFMIDTDPIKIHFLTENPYYNPLLHLNGFLMGNMAGLYFIKNANNSKQKNYAVPIFITLLILILILKYPIGLCYHNGLLSFIFVPLILFISMSNGEIVEFFQKKLFVFLGEISFGIYILQFPVWGIINDYRLNKYFQIDKESPTSAFIIRVSFLIVISSMSYLYFEQPIRNKIKNSDIKNQFRKMRLFSN